MRGVDVLVTYDVHLYVTPDEYARYLEQTMLDHDRLDIKASFLFPSDAARRVGSAVGDLVAAGHAVGCHGLTHGPDEIYDLLSARAQEETLRRATDELEAVSRQRMRFFRAPVFRISGTTLQVLDKLGYDADLSMNSQRLGLLSSDQSNVSWLMAPRRPYHPDARYPWRRGRLRLWEVPLACLALPFMSNTLLAFGPRFMKLFFRTLVLEARRTGKPIVYMSHPEELFAGRPDRTQRRLRWRDLVPTRHGFGFRELLMEVDPRWIARANRELLEYMRSFEDVRFLTVNEYVDGLQRRERPVHYASERR